MDQKRVIDAVHKASVAIVVDERLDLNAVHAAVSIVWGIAHDLGIARELAAIHPDVTSNMIVDSYSQRNKV